MELELIYTSLRLSVLFGWIDGGENPCSKIMQIRTMSRLAALVDSEESSKSKTIKIALKLWNSSGTF